MAKEAKRYPQESPGSALPSTDTPTSNRPSFTLAKERRITDATEAARTVTSGAGRLARAASPWRRGWGQHESQVPRSGKTKTWCGLHRPREVFRVRKFSPRLLSGATPEGWVRSGTRPVWIVPSVSFRDEEMKKPYSPKALLTKKSSAFSGRVPRTTHPVKYGASQTGTRRGRLRELCIRCVARKFLYLWIRMTFGRVFPSKARFYYEQRILRKTFEGWKEEWWVSHREWKLCVRADCHYRYYWYSLVFQSWKAYVQQQWEMRNKYRKAKDHDVMQKMRLAWKSWLIYVAVRRTKLQMRTTALEFRQQSVLRVWWSKWRQQLEQAHMNHAFYATAVQHRALSIQLQAWSRWKEQLLLSQRGRWKLVSAVQHHRWWQKRKFLRAWLEYLNMCRVKRQRDEMAAQLHRVTVLQVHFCDWRWAWEQRQSLHAHQALVKELARKMALRRVFSHWRHYVLLCREETARREVAERHHQRSLLNFCFRALKDNMTQVHLQQIRKNLAHRQHDMMLLRRFWNLWQSRIEQREEKEQLPLLRIAWGHYRVTLLHKCIKLWLRYTQKRRYKQRLQARADGHFQQRALPAAFHAWSRLWRWHQQEGILNTTAACFRREMLEKRIFTFWWQKMFQHRENRLAERIAILQAEGQLLRRSWSVWHQRAAACQQEREREAVACAQHHHTRLRNAFCVWKERAQGLRTERTSGVRAAQFHSGRLLRWAWSRWRESLALRAAEQQKLMRADLHGQRAVLRRALRRWLAYQGRVWSVLQEVAVRESQHNRQLTRWALRRWRKNTVARADETRKSSQASAHYRRTLCSKVLVQWREVASVRIYYRQQEACALREARKVLERGCLRSWFRRWRDHSQRAAEQKAQLERAAQHHHRQLLREAVARWQAHHLECVRKRILRRQSTQFLAQRLSWACFLQWRRQLEAKRREQQSTARALWFWAFCLQAKAWAAWLGFVRERRRKKVRLEQAVQAYHRQLLQEGAAQLLRFAASMKAFRQQLQAQQQVQAAHSLQRAVRRCAEIWKQKVLGAGWESQHLAPIAPSRRVAFEGPLLDFVAAGAGDATSEAKRLRAQQRRAALGGLVPAAGEPQLPELSAARSARKQPRCPHFLLEPVQSQRSLGCGTLKGQGPEKPQEQGQGLAWSAGPSLPRPFLTGALPNTPGPRAPSAASPSPELLPPSSFRPLRAGAAAWTSAQPAPGSKPQAPPTLACGPDPHLLLPEDFTGARARPGLGIEAAGHMDLEAELEGIQQQLQHYQTTRQNLWSCQRQASSLRKWLELSQEEPRAEDHDAEQQMQKELEEVELQIQQLSEELQAQRQPIRSCTARIQALRQALH
ncbi:PREDICTED: protein SFI1 homolog isoform X3 [Chinchilla lanigera]|uniref:protein SFI1 homolog isoform X3 n=1 Tax=Chinchilla lanigera TaxID=34839 RepID=UPI000696555E|nr:PREDICTED: protein SFI1 homolog isoform X3 [Chinchilla lanigera]